MKSIHETRYGELLGLREIAKPDALAGRGGFWLELGDIQFHVGAEDGVERRATKAHLAYQVDDLAAWRARLADVGIAVIDGAAIPGQERFELRDPFGNRVELVEPREAL